MEKKESDFAKWFKSSELAKLDLSYVEIRMIELGWDFGYNQATKNAIKMFDDEKSYEGKCNDRESLIDRRFEP